MNRIAIALLALLVAACGGGGSDYGSAVLPQASQQGCTVMPRKVDAPACAPQPAP